MEQRSTAPRIYGKEIFFNFQEIPYSDVNEGLNLVQLVKERKMDGFVIKNVFSDEEVKDILAAAAQIPEHEKMNVPTGKLFPLPFATITDATEKLENYAKQTALLNQMKSNKAVDTLLERLDVFFKKVAGSFNVNVPLIKSKNSRVAPGNFRFFMPDHGGLYVHCGYLFQAQAPFYYTVVEPMALENQLSYFVLLQNSEVGGELTIYDMEWKDIKTKDSQQENEYVLDKHGNKVYLKDVRSFSVKPLAGDILVFAGGPIWHRVEDIKGTIPRITFGGFLNFSNDNKSLFYWS